jgi:hypothetical protein
MHKPPTTAQLIVDVENQWSYTTRQPAGYSALNIRPLHKDYLKNCQSLLANGTLTDLNDDAVVQ